MLGLLAGMQPPAHKILVIEDDPDTRAQLNLLLRKHGYLPMSASSGEQAIDLAANAHPDLILLDLGLPGIDGWLTLRLLRDLTPTANVPVIVVTAYDEVRNRVQGYLTDVSEFVTKPFQPQKLVATIRSLLQEGAGALA